MNTNWKICIVELTRSCPFNCPNCYMRQRGDLNNPVDGVLHMPLDNYQRMLEIFTGQGGTGMELLGGEPSCHPNFLEVVELSLRTGLETWIYTNLSQMGRQPRLAWTLMEMRRQYDEKLFVVGKSAVPDLTDPEQRKVQAYTLGTNDAGVELFKRGREWMISAGWRKPFFGVENLLNRCNIVWAPAIYEYGLQTGYFFVDCEWPTFPGQKAGLREYLRLLPTEEQLQSFVAAIQEIDRRYGLPVASPVMPHLTGKSKTGESVGCIAFKQAALYIAVNGDMQLCSSGLPLRDETGRQFNLFRDPLDEILDNPVVIARRQSCEQSQIQSGHCATCADFSRCLAGCAAFREAFYGTALRSYPMCPQYPWDNDIRRLVESAKGDN